MNLEYKNIQTSQAEKTKNQQADWSFHIQKLKKLRRGTHEILDILLSCSFLWHKVYMSQEKMGKLKGYGREHVNRKCAELRELGFIDWENRTYSSNVYSFNPIFKNEEFLEKIRTIFNSVNTHLFKKVTLYFKKGIYTLNNNINNSLKEKRIKNSGVKKTINTIQKLRHQNFESHKEKKKESFYETIANPIQDFLYQMLKRKPPISADPPLYE